MLRTLFILGRNIRPFTPFVLVYLVEEKGYTTKEILEKIIPWWLYSMLVFSLIVPFLVARAGVLHCIILSICADLGWGLLLIGMKPRSVHATILSEVLGAFRSSITVADKRYYSADSRERTIVYSTVRKITGIISSFVSQNMYYISGGSRASLYLTTAVQGLVLIGSLALEEKSGATVTEMVSLRKIEAGMLAHIFSYTGAFTISTCLKIYIDLILIERTGRIEEGGSVGVFVQFLDFISYIFYVLSLGIIKVMSYFSEKISVAPYVNRKKALHGYLEGITKIFSVCLAIPLVKSVYRSYIYSETLSIISWVVQIGGIIFIRRSKSIREGYIAYLIAFLGSCISLSISYIKIDQMASEQIIGIMSYIGGVSCAVHAGVDMISRRKKLSAETRFSLYARLGSILFLCAGIFSAIEYIKICKKAE